MSDDLTDIKVALGKLETKVDERFQSMEKVITDLTSWKDRTLWLLVSLVLVAVVTTLFGSGAVRLP